MPIPIRQMDEYDSLVAADVEKISDSSNIGEGQKQDILRLAISYYQRSNQLALEKLAQVIGGGGRATERYNRLIVNQQ